MSGFKENLPDLNFGSLAATAAIGGALIGVSYLIKSSRRYSGAPPGPRRVPIFGSTEFAPKDGTDAVLEIDKLTKKYGPIMCVYLGSKTVIIISEYTILREAFLTKGIELAGRNRNLVAEVLFPESPVSRGIIDGNYSEEWKRQRHTALTILRQLGWGKSTIEKTIQVESHVLLEELAKTNCEPADPANLMETCVANIICSLLFGERYEHSDKEFRGFMHNVEELLTAAAEDPGGEFIPFMKLTPKYRKVKKAAVEAAGKLRAFYESKIMEAKDRIARGEEPADFVTLYLKELEMSDSAESKFKEDWTAPLIHDFFLAGAETTATTMKWAILFMANNPEVQEKVFQEINTKVGKNDTLCLKDRENLPYTEATSMEIQRRASLVPLGAPHRAMVDTTVAGYVIPEDAMVMSYLHAILRDPKQFPEPMKLKPERFLSENLDSVVKNDHWIPFSLGRRTCLGEQLARQELFLFFSNVIRSFKILPPEGVQEIKYSEVFTLVQKPTDYKVRFIPRT